MSQMKGWKVGRFTGVEKKSIWPFLLYSLGGTLFFYEHTFVDFKMKENVHKLYTELVSTS